MSAYQRWSKASPLAASERHSDEAVRLERLATSTRPIILGRPVGYLRIILPTIGGEPVHSKGALVNQLGRLVST